MKMENEDQTTIFAQRLKELRTANNMSLKDLASELDTTPQSLSLYERAERTINIDLFAKIVKRFNVSADWLCGMSDNTNQPYMDCTLRDYLKSIVTVLSVSLNTYDDDISAIKLSDLCDRFFSKKISSLINAYQTGSIAKNLLYVCIDKVINDFINDSENF